MSPITRRSVAPLLAGLLAVAAGPAVKAQDATPAPDPVASPSPAPGIAEVALCEMPELGERAGSVGPLIASIGDVPLGEARRVLDVDAPSTDELGCRLPTVQVEDVIDSGRPIEMFQTTDIIGDAPGSPGIAQVLHASRDTSAKEAARILKDKKIQKSGKVTKKLLTGNVWVVCVELEAELKPGDSVVLGTDVKHDATRRAPSGVEVPMNPLANVRDLYHLGLLPTDGSVFLGSTDLATSDFYTGKRPFAAWLAGTNAYFLIPRSGLGQDFRAVVFRSGEGSDVAGLGASPRIPSDGEAGWIEECISYALFHDPLEFLGAAWLSYGQVELCFRADEEITGRLESWLDAFGDDEGVATGEIDIVLREGTETKEATLPFDVFVDDDGDIYFSLPIGYLAYGFHALENIKEIRFESTEDFRLDTVFHEAAKTIVRALNPVVFSEAEGQLQGTGPCIADLQG